MRNNTIAAIATGLSDSGIGIIRISGEDSFKTADRIFRDKNGKRRIYDYKTHTIHYGYIYDEDEIIDEVLVSLMKAPNTYTTEDVVEINCHGGVRIMHKILEVVLKNGASLAEPGEFTKRAFLGGRMDLSKAEAVIDMIHSTSEAAMKSSVRQLKGELSDKIKTIREMIISEVAFIEAAIDDPEHISTEGYADNLYKITEDVEKDIKELVDSYRTGRLIKQGIRTVIAGKPNAGKSSLLNALAGEERAIVTNVAGTTRDAIEEYICIGELSLNIVDTAGIRDTEDIVEKIGVSKTIQYIDNYDLILYVVDSSICLDENDESIIRRIHDKNYIVVYNKSDITPVISEKDIVERFRIITGDNELYPQIVKISAKDNKGTGELINKITDIFIEGTLSLSDEIYITNERHKNAMERALNDIKLVRKSLDDGMPEDFYSIDLMNAYSHLGEIIGEEAGEDLINKIFSEFCMGK